MKTNKQIQEEEQRAAPVVDVLVEYSFEVDGERYGNRVVIKNNLGNIEESFALVGKNFRDTYQAITAQGKKQ